MKLAEIFIMWVAIPEQSQDQRSKRSKVKA